MGRRPCCCKEEELNRGSWTAIEDKILTDYITLHGEGQWRNLPKKAGLKRCGKSCRLRWLNYLRPDIKRGNITDDEEDLIVRLHKLLGNRWSLIAGRLPGRTDNEIKNYWNTNIGKKRTQATKTNQHKEETNATNGQTLVIRTKATRCTKVFIPPKPQVNPQTNTNKPSSSNAQELVHKDHVVHQNQSEPSDFIAGLEMDDGFLSDLLNADISLFCGYDDNEVHEDNKDTCVGDHHHGSFLVSSSSNFDPTHLLDEHKLHDPDLHSLSPFLDSELNWI